MVAVLAHGVGAGTRGLQARRPKTLSESEHPLGAAKAIERAIAEQGVDDDGTGHADLGGALATPGRRLQEEVDLIGRQMRGERAALPGPRPTVRGDERVLVKEFDLPGRGAHPQPLADQAMRRRVVGGGEDDVAVGMELGRFPLGGFPRRGRQGREGDALDLIEDLKGDPLGRAVHAVAGGLDTPAEQVAIAVMQVAEGAPSQGVAFDVVDAALFELPLVLGVWGRQGAIRNP